MAVDGENWRINELSLSAMEENVTEMPSTNISSDYVDVSCVTFSFKKYGLKHKQRYKTMRV